MTGKKRRRGLGPFICLAANCGKVFSRSDHLARHNANHSSSKFKCGWPGCEKSFARPDVKKKHESRHSKNSDKPCGMEVCKDGPKCNGNASTSNKGPPGDLKDSRYERSLEEKNASSPPSFAEPQHVHEILKVQDNTDGLVGKQPNQSANQNDLLNTRSLDYNNVSALLEESDGSLVQSRKPEENEAENSIEAEPAAQQSFDLSNCERPESLATQLNLVSPFHWLLNDTIDTSPEGGRSSTQVEDGAFQAYRTGELGLPTFEMLKKVFSLAPHFPDVDCQSEVNADIVCQMKRHIPGLTHHPDFVAPKIKWFLDVFWHLYHCQYPILHRPSFSVVDCQPLLLLSMVMMGASYSKRTNVPDQLDIKDSDGLADAIAEPLRWLIFASEEAKPPCRSWVLQSLIILETFEVTGSSRTLHERACIFRGAKIQLLRRSPILGSNPSTTPESDTSQESGLWNTWIENESMKRVALMSFYIDTLHAIVFGHPVGLLASQIKLSLPCPEYLWEYRDVDRHGTTVSVAHTPLFSEALRSLLQKDKIDVGAFSRKILFAGLANLLLQMEQNVCQWSNFGLESVHEGVKDKITSAMDFWRTQLPGGTCRATAPIKNQCDLIQKYALSPSVGPKDTSCIIPEFHAAQIYLRITHHDYIVLAGAPERMNVPILLEDYNFVVKRIEGWVKSSSGSQCAINALIMLFETLLSPDDSVKVVHYLYEPDKDPYVYRPNIVVSAALSLWTYAFHLYGPEAQHKYAGDVESSFVPAMEDSSAYLTRIRSRLSFLTGRTFASLKSLNAEEYSGAIDAYCNVLSKVSHINNLVGLLTTLRNGYKKCHWHVGQEYANLLDNCIRRSLGNEVIFCHNMYKVRK